MPTLFTLQAFLGRFRLESEKSVYTENTCYALASYVRFFHREKCIIQLKYRKILETPNSNAIVYQQKKVITKFVIIFSTEGVPDEEDRDC